MGRQLRTRLNLVIPDLTKHVQDAQNIQKNYHDQHAKDRDLTPGDRVLICKYSGSPSWLPGTIKTVLGLVSYQVELKDGRLWKRHLDQLLKDNTELPVDNQVDQDLIDFPLTESTDSLLSSSTLDCPIVRCSTRVRHPPDRLTM